MDEFDVNDQRQEFEQKPIVALCELCDESAKGTAATLTARGWGLYQRVQFCPVHEAEV